MDSFSPSDLKTILHSKRANLYYLEHCRVLVNGGRVEYVTDQGKSSVLEHPHRQHHHPPSRHRYFHHSGRDARAGESGVLVGFCGGGGTPLFCANEVDFEVAWFRRRANTVRPNTCNTGCVSGSTMVCAWKQPRPSNAPDCRASPRTGTTAR